MSSGLAFFSAMFFAKESTDLETASKKRSKALIITVMVLTILLLASLAQNIYHMFRCLVPEYPSSDYEYKISEAAVNRAPV